MPDSGLIGQSASDPFLDPIALPMGALGPAALGIYPQENTNGDSEYNAFLLKNIFIKNDIGSKQ